MKILHVFSYFSLQTGGGTVDLIYKITKALSDRGHQVTIWTSDYEEDMDYVNSLKPVNVELLHSVFSFSGLHIIPELDFKAWDNLKKFDIIHLHAQRSLLHMPICKYAIRYKIPYVIDAHGSTPMFTKKFFKMVYDKFYGRKIYSHCSQFIAENKLGESEYIELGIVQPKITIIMPPKEMITIINPPMDVESFEYLPTADLFRSQYKLNNKKIVMFLGRLHKIKGIKYLIDGFAELRKRRGDVVLVIAGADDGDKLNLENQIRQLQLDDVIFTGYITGQMKLSALVSADVLVQSSVYEQGAWCPLEAILCGTPAIVSEHTGAGMDMLNIAGGYLVNIYNKKQMADKIDWVLNNQAEARAKALQGAEYIKNNLSLTASVSKYEDMYLKCLNRS